MRYFLDDYFPIITLLLVCAFFVGLGVYTYNDRTKDSTKRGAFYTQIEEVEGQRFVIFWNEDGLHSQPLATNAEEGGSDGR